MFALCAAERHEELTKLLQLQKPWSVSGVQFEVFHRNSEGQTLRQTIDAAQSTQPAARISSALLQEHEEFWMQQLKPALIEALTQECGMAKDAALICVGFIDGCSAAKATSTAAESKQTEQ